MNRIGSAGFGQTQDVGAPGAVVGVEIFASTHEAGEQPYRAWFNREPVWVTPLGLREAIILTRSVSEGTSYARLRFGLGCPECHPELNRAAL